MGKLIGKEVSVAAADAVGLVNVDVIAAYPITPQTHIVEHLSELVAAGELDAEYIPVESEHSAMSVCCGSSARGARTFTCTSSQGLALMNEVVFIASSLRLPIVMVVCNRHLSAPIGIANDHSDIMPVRDSGWIQVFAENGQEVFDHVIHAFRVAESEKVSLPVIVNMDGFVLSHMIEPIEYWEEEMVKQYLPEFKPLYRLDPDDPITIGALTMSEYLTEAKMAQNEALKNALPEIVTAWDEMAEITGRQYRPVEKLHEDSSETLFLTMGSISGIVSDAVDQLREQGESVNLLKLRLFRPFPFKALKEAVGNARRVIVIDRAVSFGGPPGPVASEIRSAFYSDTNRPMISGFICGLGGRDLIPDDYINIYRESLLQTEGGATETEDILYGVKA